MKNNIYEIAGFDLSEFVANWISELESSEGDARGLLSNAKSDSELEERYGYGALYMMANVGPQANEPKATSEVVLLFAVMSLYQDAGFPNADPTLWEGEQVHIDRAFTYFHHVGAEEAARQLRETIIRRSLHKKSVKSDPAQGASHDQEMAAIDARSIRAAKLLHPEGDFDSEMLRFTP